MQLKECIEIYVSFFKIGTITFGGGYSMLPILEHEVGNKKGWVSKQELLDYFAMGQTLPGIIAINVATFVGSKRGGFLGALSAVLGVVSPSILIISLIAAFISSFAENPLVKKVLFGMNLGVAALLVNSVAGMARKVVIDPVTAFLALLAFAAVAFFGLHSVIVLAVGVGAGLILRWKPRKNIKDGSEDESA